MSFNVPLVVVIVGRLRVGRENLHELAQHLGVVVFQDLQVLARRFFVARTEDGKRSGDGGKGHALVEARRVAGFRGRFFDRVGCNGGAGGGGGVFNDYVDDFFHLDALALRRVRVFLESFIAVLDHKLGNQLSARHVDNGVIKWEVGRGFVECGQRQYLAWGKQANGFHPASGVKKAVCPLGLWRKQGSTRCR